MIMFETTKVKEIIDAFIVNEEIPDRVFILNDGRCHLELDYSLDNVNEVFLMTKNSYEKFEKDDTDNWIYSVCIA